MKDKIKALPRLEEMQSRFIEIYQILGRLPDEPTERYIRRELEKFYKILDEMEVDITRESAAEILRICLGSRRYFGN